MSTKVLPAWVCRHLVAQEWTFEDMVAAGAEWVDLEHRVADLAPAFEALDSAGDDR